MSTWAIIADVVAKTGRTVTQSDVDRAEGTIETLTGVIAGQSLTLLGRRDLYWLQAATAYQAAWLADQPDAFTRSDVAGVSQDGVSATLKPDALVLAPNARRALKRLSWRGTRTLSPTLARAATTDDDVHNWRPL